jgi:hypothetical protein
MSTEVEKEVSLHDLAQEVASLREEVRVYERVARRFEKEVLEYQEANHSKRGLSGGRGETGAAGRDAVIRIVQTDGKAQVIDVPSGQVVAEMISVPGPAGKDAPSLAEIVKAVVHRIGELL